MNAGRIELLDHARLRGQLLGLERRVARGGRDSVDHAPGSHDDLANAVAGVLVAIRSTARVPLCIDGISYDRDGNPLPDDEPDLPVESADAEEPEERTDEPRPQFGAFLIDGAWDLDAGTTRDAGRLTRLSRPPKLPGAGAQAPAVEDEAL